MIKGYVYAGLVLLAVGAVVLYLVSSFITSGSPTSIVNVTVLRGSIGDVPLRVNATAVSIIFAFASNTTNIYFLNQSTFSGLSSYLGANASGSGYSYVLSHNVNRSDVFQDNNSAIKEEYQVSPNASAPSYYVYAVIDSTDGSPSYNSVVNATVVYKSYSYGSWVTRSGEALVGIAALILGIALLIYGALKKPKQVEIADAPAEEPKRRGKRNKG